MITVSHVHSQVTEDTVSMLRKSVRAVRASAACRFTKRLAHDMSVMSAAMEVNTELATHTDQLVEHIWGCCSQLCASPTAQKLDEMCSKFHSKTTHIPKLHTPAGGFGKSRWTIPPP